MRRVEVSEQGVIGVVWKPDVPTAFAVVLPGSGGGIPEGYARRLAEGGVCAFALAYFGLEGLPRVLVEVPLEQLYTGIRYFASRFAGGAPVGLMGVSKGAELVLVLASRLGEEVGPVVAVAPTCVAWYGLDQADTTSMQRSSWTSGGEPVPFLAYPPHIAPTFGPAGVRLDVCYRLADHSSEAVTRASIVVEDSSGPLLLLSGEDDHMWPAAPMAETVVARMAQHGTSSGVTSVIYPGAGHIFLHGEFLPAGSPFDFGGTPEADAKAAADAWPRLIRHLGGPL